MYTIQELQVMALSDDKYLSDLGRAVLHIEFDCSRPVCIHEQAHREFEANMNLDPDPIDDCPHCGKLLDMEPQANKEGLEESYIVPSCENGYLSATGWDDCGLCPTCRPEESTWTKQYHCPAGRQGE